MSVRLLISPVVQPFMMLAKTSRATPIASAHFAAHLLKLVLLLLYIQCLEHIVNDESEVDWF